MKSRANIFVFILSIILVQLPVFLSANDNIEAVKGNLIVGKGATVNIGNSAKITVAGIITLEADITGEGELILNSDNSSFIDANNHTIENLVLVSANTVELKSGLTINSKFVIKNGSLQLNDFNLTLNYVEETTQTTLAKIIINGAGRIINCGIPFCSSKTPYTVTTTVDFNFALCPATIPALKRNSSPIVFCYTNFLISTQNIRVLAPPPKV